MLCAWKVGARGVGVADSVYFLGFAGVASSSRGHSCIFLVGCSQNLMQIPQELWNVGFDDVPDDVIIDSPKLMHEDVSRTSYQPPRNLRMVRLERLWNVRCRFADQYQIPHRGVV